MSPRDRITFSPMHGKRLEHMAQSITAIPDAFPTSFPMWNRACGEEGGRVGLAKKWLVVVAGADGSGKSYMLLNLAANGVREGKKVGFINFEMTELGMTTRFLSILSGLPKYRLEHGKYFSMDVWLQAKGVADQIYSETGGMLVANQTAVFGLEDIREAYSALVATGCDVVCIDYAQLIFVAGADGIFGRSEAVANELRVLTHEFDVTTIVAAQLNRAGKHRKRPSRHDIAGGAVWENNANQILLINHYGSEIDKVDQVKYTEVIIDKNRHGVSPLVIPVHWDLRNMRWTEDAEISTVEVGGIDDDEMHATSGQVVGKIGGALF